MVTHPTTNWPACGLSTAERTGSPVLHTLWSYVIETFCNRLMLGPWDLQVVFWNSRQPRMLVPIEASRPSHTTQSLGIE